MGRTTTPLNVALVAAGVAAAAGMLARRRRVELRGRVVVITGGSRGLGFILAREFARHGARLALCARTAADLERARAALPGADVWVEQCDVGDARQVRDFIAGVLEHYGQIDVLVNNAGIIEVGPLDAMSPDAFRRALDVMFWGMLETTLAVLPHMRARRQGSIVNVTSIGGKVSVPHLLPYCCAKFAAVGLSEGLRSELRRDGVDVVTIVPGLMRTGSHLNAQFVGRQKAEFRWFALGATLPLVSMDAERAARQIVAAVRRGEAERILSLPAQLLARLHGVAPGLTAELLTLANRLLPGAGVSVAPVRGMTIQAGSRLPVLRAVTALGLTAARRFQHWTGNAAAAR